MKLKIDTHNHTIMSGHAYSTIREMAEMARERGLEAVFLTEHAPNMPGTCQQYYFDNLRILPRKRYGIHTFFGAELNIMNTEGEVDLPEKILKRMDLSIASIHTPCYRGEKTIEAITNAYVNAMKNPYVHVIGHPDDSRFPVDYEILVKAAKETGTLLEINNSSMRPETNRVGGRENILTMLSHCKKYQVPVVTGSDAHLDLDVGNFQYVEEVLAESGFPEELVLTTSLEKLQAFIKE